MTPEPVGPQDRAPGRGLRVLIDARTVFAAERRGTGKNLVDLYRTLAVRRPHWDLVMLHQRRTENPFDGLPNVRARRVDIPGDRYDAWELLRLPLAALSERADVMHCPANSAPRLSGTPIVATIHDLIALDGPADDEATLRWRRCVTRAAKVAQKVITPSSFTRRMLTERLRVDASRVTVNPWAPDLRVERVTDVRLLRAAASRHGLTGSEPYVLAFGAADPRKNSRRIVQAWAAIPKAARRNARLLMVGFQRHVLAEAERMAADGCPDRSCLVSGFASEADMPALISGASCLCYPSLSEGFGLPVLDAFVCETPVITSTVTSLPEVAGDAALLVDPTDVEAITAALTQLLTSAAERARLASAGKRRVLAFSWERCADTTAAVLETAARSRRRGES